MNTLEAIAERRSIRKFKEEPIPDEALRAILTAGIQAPSGKNRQPWCFVVVRGEEQAEMVRVMREGMAKLAAQGANLGSAEWTTKIIEQAPVTVFVFDAEGMPPWQDHTIDQMFTSLVNVQSIGAAVQNMLLAARDRGIGSLWICDVLFAYEELCQWLGEESAMVAAVSLATRTKVLPPGRASRSRRSCDISVEQLQSVKGKFNEASCIRDVRSLGSAVPIQVEQDHWLSI